MAACRYAELTYYSLLLLLLFGQPTATRRLKQSPPSDSNEQAVLLTFADKLTNFQVSYENFNPIRSACKEADACTLHLDNCKHSLCQGRLQLTNLNPLLRLGKTE